MNDLDRLNASARKLNFYTRLLLVLTILIAVVTIYRTYTYSGKDNPQKSISATVHLDTGGTFDVKTHEGQGVTLRGNGNYEAFFWYGCDGSVSVIVYDVSGGAYKYIEQATGLWPGMRTYFTVLPFDIEIRR